MSIDPWTCVISATGVGAGFAAREGIKQVESIVLSSLPQDDVPVFNRRIPVYSDDIAAFVRNMSASIEISVTVAVAAETIFQTQEDRMPFDRVLIRSCFRGGMVGAIAGGAARSNEGVVNATNGAALGAVSGAFIGATVGMMAWAAREVKALVLGSPQEEA